MLNGARYQWKEEVGPNILAIQSTTMNNREMTTIKIVAAVGSIEGNQTQMIEGV
jgi:hypothetical protein